MDGLAEEQAETDNCGFEIHGHSFRERRKLDGSHLIELIVFSHP
jgi:hypothetical protein